MQKINFKFKANNHYRILFTAVIGGSKWMQFRMGNSVKKLLNKYSSLAELGYEIHDVTDCPEFVNIGKFENLVYKHVKPLNQ